MRRDLRRWLLELRGTLVNILQVSLVMGEELGDGVKLSLISISMDLGRDQGLGDGTKTPCSLRRLRAGRFVGGPYLIQSDEREVIEIFF